MPQFVLFRIKLISGLQGVLFDEAQSPATTITRLLRLKPSVELRQGYTWHIGNVEQVEGLGLSFALGRTTKSTVERYDEESQDFIEEDFETSPYTHALFDAEYQVLAIAHKQRLAQTVKTIANSLERLLNDVLNLGTPSNTRIEIAQINDPSSFLAST
jgi:hypothetical protein